MSFDIEKVLKEMIDTISNTVKEGSGDIKSSVNDIMKGKKSSLNELGEALARNEISDAEFENEIKREKKVIEIELLTIKIMTKALAQKAVNAALDVFVKAVKLAL